MKQEISLRIFTLLFFLLPIAADSQNSLIELLTKFNSADKTDLIKENHTTQNFIRLFDDEEEKADSTIEINGVQTKFKRISIQRTTWDGKLMTINSYSDGSSAPTSTEIIEFDINNNIVSKVTEFTDENMSFMNEKMTYDYDNKNRLTNIHLSKNDVPANTQILKIDYENNNNLPISAEMDLIMEMNLHREPIDKGYRYHFDIKIPDDLIQMVKSELGDKATDEEIKKALGPFGKVQKKYSDIVFLEDGNLKEEVFEENKEIEGQLDLISKVIFDKNFNILSKKDFVDGQVSSTVIYEYNDHQKVKSVQFDENPKMENEYDSQGNMIKENNQFGYFFMHYKDGKLSQKLEYDSAGDIIIMEIYTY